MFLSGQQGLRSEIDAIKVEKIKGKICRPVVIACLDSLMETVKPGNAILVLAGNPRALGIDFSQAVLARADEVVE